MPRRRGPARRPRGSRTRSRSRPGAGPAAWRTRGSPSSAFIRATSSCRCSRSRSSPEREQGDRDRDERERRPRSRSATTQRLRALLGCRRRRRREGSQSLDRVVTLRHDPNDRHGIGEALQGKGPAILVPDAVDPPREVGDLPRCEDLAGASLTAEPSGQVQRSAPIAALDGDRLARVEPDADRERQLRARRASPRRSAAAGRRRRGSPLAQRRTRIEPRRRGAPAACHREPRHPRARCRRTSPPACPRPRRRAPA